MLTFVDIGGMQVLCVVPTTTVEVLDFRVRIRCLSSVETRIAEAARWLSRRTEIPPDLAAEYIPNEPIPQRVPTPSLLEALLRVSSEELPAHVLLYQACEDLCAAACIDQAVLDGIVRLRDKQSGIDPEWKPASPCGCIRCNWPGDPEEAPTTLPDGMECIYSDVDGRATDAAVAVWGLGDPTEPHWMTQIRGALQKADGRRLAWGREEQKEHARWSEKNDELAALLGQKRG